MPWKVIETDGKWCVFKLGAGGQPDGEPMVCHATEDEADAQVAALYANEQEDAGKSANAKVGRRHSKQDVELLRGIRDGAKQIIAHAVELGADEEDVAEAVGDAVDSIMGTATRSAPDDLLAVKSLGPIASAATWYCGALPRSATLLASISPHAPRG